MSGICGIVRFDGQPVKKEEIQKMLNAMQKRGDDSEGIWVDANVGLGHKMLWTTPESLKENQPLVCKGDNFILTADARIDNRDELFEELDLNVNNDAIITDADLILMSYEKWGENCPSYLHGDFAFAIWDNEKNKLFLARDRFGIRQMYYYNNNEIIIFATSMEAIFSLDILDRTIDIQSVKKYTKLRALNKDESFFKNIKRLPSSNMMNISSGQWEIKRYWFPEKIKMDTTLSLEEAGKKFSLLFDNAIKVCLRSSHPISIEVSGGLDSSSIYSVAMSMKTTQPLSAHTIQHKDLPSDETFYIQSLEKKFNSDIVKFDINKVDFKKYNLSYFYTHYKDWPGKGNFIEFVMKNKELHDRGIRVVITGIGADEILGGNAGYMLPYLKKLNIKVPYSELKCIGKRAKSKITFLKYVFLTLCLNPGKYHIKKFVKNILSKLPMENNPYKNTLNLNDIEFHEKIQNYSMELEGAYLLSSRFSYWMDFNALQNYNNDGIEVRHPFLDTKLVEFIISLPPEYLYHCGQYKSILKSAMNNVLPDEILYRNNKTCLGPGIKLQMKKMLNNEMLNCEYLIKNKLVDERKILEYKTKYLDSIISTSEFIDYWIIMNLEVWFKNKEGK